MYQMFIVNILSLKDGKDSGDILSQVFIILDLFSFIWSEFETWLMCENFGAFETVFLNFKDIIDFSPWNNQCSNTFMILRSIKSLLLETKVS